MPILPIVTGLGMFFTGYSIADIKNYFSPEDDGNGNFKNANTPINTVNVTSLVGIAVIAFGGYYIYKKLK